MINVECHEYQGPIVDPYNWPDGDMASNYIRNMFAYSWITHFVVTGPGCKCIVRRRESG